MYLRASKDLDEPADMHSLIDASAFPYVFALYVVLVWGVFYCIRLCFLVLSQTNMRELKTENIFVFKYILFFYFRLQRTLEDHRLLVDLFC